MGAAASEDLLAFITEPYPRGIGTTQDTIETMMRLKHRHEGMDPAVDARMASLREEVRNLLNAPQPVKGTNQHTYASDNVRSSFGNDPDYALRRLKRDEPELAQRVLKGEISAHAAAVQAGFRPRTITVPLDPEKMARAIRRRLSDDELDVLLKALEAAS